MAASPLAAYGLYAHRIALNEVTKSLNQAGFGNQDICMMLSPRDPIAALVRDAKVMNADPEATAVRARLIGWLGEFGAVVIPTVGFFIRSQEFFQAIVEETGSPTRCGASRTLEGLGFPAGDAQRFDSQLRHVGVLLYVSCPESAQTKWAQELLRGTGAEETGTLDETSSSLRPAKPEPRPAKPLVAFLRPPVSP